MLINQLDFTKFRSFYWGAEDPSFHLVTKETVLSRDAHSNGVLSYVCVGATEQIAFVQHCVQLGGTATLELDSNGIRMSPLHHAAMSGHLRIIRFLLDLGIPVDITDHGARTPLSCAIQMGNLSVCRLLVDAGARTDKLAPWQIYPISDWRFPQQREYARKASIVTLAILRCGGKTGGNGKNILTIIARCVWESRAMQTWAQTIQPPNAKKMTITRKVSVPTKKNKIKK